MIKNDHIPIDHPNYRRAVLLKCIIVSFIIISVIFSLINFLSGIGPDVYIVQLLSAVLMFLIGVYYHKRKNLEVASFITTIFTVFNVTYLYIYLEMRADFIIWVVILPLLYFFLVKRKTAIILSVAYILIISGLLISKFINTGEAIVFKLFLNYFFAELVFVFFAFYFERSGWIIANELKIKNRVLKKLAEIDTLTGLYNRNAINAHMDNVIKNKTNFSVIMLDIDDFKSINDKFGHFIGDRVLAEVGLVLQTFSGKDILCGRWGGEEFLIICNKNEAEVFALAEEIRKKLVVSAFLNGEGIPTSMGVAEHCDDEDPNETISRADKALYIAKSNGKGRVESCEK